MKVERETKKLQKKIIAKVSQRCSELPKGALMVALSGGADSVALLNLLLECRCDVVAVHCNFHLRGQESDRDEQFCRSLCDRLGVKLAVKNFDTYSESEPGESLEMVCRRIRYDFFRGFLLRGECVRIVTGHNADDNLETMLLNLTRGAGLHGLSGMNIDSGEVFRPLLDVSRSEIETYLVEKGETWITDSTNLESDYNRNFIRNEIVSRLRERFPAIIESASKTQFILKGECRLVDRLLDEVIEDATFLSWNKLEGFPDRLSLIKRFLDGSGFSYATMLQICKATYSAQRSGKMWRVGESELRFERDGVYLRRERGGEVKEERVLKCERIPINKESLLRMRSCRDNKELWLPNTLDNYIVRHPRRGDRIKSLGMKGSQLLSDIMSDAKLRGEQRAGLFVVENCSDGEIVWVEGLKRSRCHLVSPTAPEMYRIYPVQKK